MCLSHRPVLPGGLLFVLQDQGGSCAEPYASLWKHRFPGRGAAKAHCWEILSGQEALAEMSGEGEEEYVSGRRFDYLRRGGCVPRRGGGTVPVPGRIRAGPFQNPESLSLKIKNTRMSGGTAGV